MKISKPSKTLILKRTGAALLCVALGWYLKGRMTPSMGMSGMGQGTPYVLIQEVQKKDITEINNHIAHVEAINSVDLLPQVSGTVDDVLFQEGSFVKKGDLLFVIEQDRYAAVLSLREAELASAKANLTEAERNYNRQIKLTKENIASKATFDAAESAYLRAKAAVQQAESNLSLARIDMGYTKVTAPISGYIGKAFVTKGNYVTASAQVLAKIVQVDPIRVTFSLTDKEFLNLKQVYAADTDAKFKARLTLPDGSVKIEDFTSRFADNEVSSNTATVSIYTDFVNGDEKLLPGNYIQIALVKENPAMNVMIPQASLAQDEQGFYTYVVNADNVVEERRLVLGKVIGSEQVVEQGLNAGDKVIVQGLQKVQNGVAVNAALVQSN
jgi:RND family efflux transporter MFP subunit